ncbi:hypothetical protein U1Q18_033265 [Sarracenia purpurea var. burkii]
MRKKAQERKRAASSPRPSSISYCSSSASTNAPTVISMPIMETKQQRSFYDTGGVLAAPSSSISKSSSPNNPPPATDSMPLIGDIKMLTPVGKKDQEVGESKEKGYSMDDIWKDIDLSGNDPVKSAYGCNFSCQTMASPIWNYCPDLLWMVEEEESKMFPATIADEFLATSSTLTD